MANRSDWKNYKKPPSEDLKKDLTPLQYEVTQKEGTEKPFKNEYWNHHEEGLYVDRLSGEPLFSSKHKFDSGTGWPSFTQPLLPEQLILKEDRRLFSVRTEVRSKLADSHLGHVFKDGPPPTGLRYCINSASLRFIPLADLEKFGYGEFLTHFTPSPQPPSKDKGNTNKREPSTLASSTATTEKAILAGGCFWGMEELIREQPGVVATQVGYTGGTLKNPTYETVKTGNTGHAEAIEVEFDPKKTSYRKILKFFFRIHDPTTLNQQGHDKGSQYRSAIFYLNEEQKTIADMIKTEEENSGRWNNKPIVTQITPASTFFEAEDYHQDYLKKNPGGYTCHYVRE